MLGNRSNIVRSQHIFGHNNNYNVSSVLRYVWNERGPPKVGNGQTEKKFDIPLDNQSWISSQKVDSCKDDVEITPPAAARSLELALSECIPHSVSTISVSQKGAKLKLKRKQKDSLPNKSSERNSVDVLEFKGKKRNAKVDEECKNENLERGLQQTRERMHNRTSRISEVNIQMLSKGLFEQVFGKMEKCQKPRQEQIIRAQQELAKHDFLSSEQPCMEDVNFKLPSLEGGTLQNHFRIIGEQQCRPYRTLLEGLVCELPEMPKEWCLQPGWTKYNRDNSSPEPVPFPAEDALVFDVEVCCSAGDVPTIAVAVSPNAWYAWVSDSVISGSSGSVGQYYLTKDLIPLESGPLQRGVGHGITTPRIIVGHNVSYDRARIKEQYWLEGTGMRFIDTMSLHVCVSGVTSYQRTLLKSAVTNSSEDSDKESREDEDWRQYSSLNSLSEVHKLYCGAALDKTTRDIFVSGTLEDVASQFQTVMKYCAGDVAATHNVLRELLPLFLSRFPHPVTLAGMLELSTAYLPVNSNWNRYLTDAQQTFDDLDTEARYLLARRADNTCQLLHEDRYQDDLWMWDQDWSVQELKLKKSVGKRSKDDNRVKKILSEEIDKENEYNGDDLKERKGRKNLKVQNKTISSEKENKLEESRNSSFNNDCDNLDEPDILSEKFQYLIETRKLLPAKMPHLPGYPAWYRKLCPRPTVPEWIPGPQLISTSMQVTPKLLCLSWESYPLHYVRGHGWGFLVPYSVDGATASEQVPRVPLKKLLESCPISDPSRLMAGPNESKAALSTLHQAVEANVSMKAFYKRKIPDETPKWYRGTGIWCNVDIGGCCWFLKLPHKDGNNHRVGNPLAKDFLNKFSENVLTGADAGAEKVLTIGRMLSYWRNNRERIEQQLVIWLGKRDLPRTLRELDNEFGAIIPQVIVCGTLTRRAVEPTWMTASNAHKERIGSEVRAMVQAPPGYSIVGADVDSQELWIASIIGDSYFAKIHGATPFGWMTLSGRKADGTDMHSVTAKAIGISRDHAKVINYARIYGAGQQFAERLLKQFNPAMSDSEAKAKASKMFAMTKGKRKYRLKESYREVLEDRLYSMTEALKLRAKHGITLEEMFEHPQWIGGTESAMFNRLEEIANSKTPVTPFLNGRLSRALEPKEGMDDRYLPTRVNWVVQSGAVDFLHLMLVSMRWLLDNQARFCLSFHDEVRYLVPEEQKYQTALALHVTNLLARAFCAQQLGLHDLPHSVAFFSSVEVDTVLRKEAHQDCITPSNPHGLSKGYGIPQGESLDIYQALHKAGGVLKAANRRTKKRCHEQPNGNM
ncbi:DNA polymerase subunit gamma-1, mitochondrial isoform X1 [Periplaneta americana]|uniref:DNA polymerase subunit gamma-1, mitochondrial isoform X1 n=1 Tax=Periplaneta americana TaxID=6978 RepID=UPI0037E964BF